MSKVISYLSMIAAVALALSPVFTPINAEYAAVAGVVAALAAGLSARLTTAVALPGGPVATGLAVLAALALSLVNGLAPGMLDPALATFLTGLAAAIATFGESVFGWGK